MADIVLKKTALPVSTFGELQKAGELLGQCKMLGCSNPAEGFIVAATCYQEGMTFLDFSNKFDIIEGRPRKKAETMLAELRQRGGNYIIRERSPEVVSVEFQYGKNTYLSTLAWKDIEQEPYTRAGKDEMQRPYPPTVPLEKRRFKDNWSTPRRRMQMMWARCVSDGVRVICPEVTQGMYTPEEATDFEQTTPAIPATPTPTPVVTPIQVPMVEPTQPTVTATPPDLTKSYGQMFKDAPQNLNIPMPQVAAAEPATPFDVSAAVEASAPVVAQGDDGLSPFHSSEAKGSVCHVKGQYDGCSWHIVPTDYCRTILAAAEVEGVTPEDREFIKDSLKQRGVL